MLKVKKRRPVASSTG